jgi:pimeloyl-ACP methyl ester carboxylesterase
MDETTVAVEQSQWSKRGQHTATPRERSEGHVLTTLLRFCSPGTLGRLMVWASKPKPRGTSGLSREQAQWMHSLMAQNRAAAMREAARGLITFDSRPWLREIKAPTLVIAGTHDDGVPRHHFDMLVKGIPGAVGYLIKRGGHTLVWTHTQEFADRVRGA